MKLAALLSEFLVLCLALQVNSQNATYRIVAPQYVRSGLPYTMYVNLLKETSGSVPVGVIAELVSLEGKTRRVLTSVSETIPSGQQKFLKMMPSQTLNGLKLFLVVRSTSGPLSFNHSKDLILDSKSGSIFIQTDKAVYKPGQTVQFRVVTVNKDLKPYTAPFNIFLMDSKQTIKQWLNQNSSVGVISLTYKLASQTVLGDWKIKVEAMSQTKIKTFSVDQYVLPKYKVRLITPSYHLLSSGDLVFSVEAKYTYGKSVAGKANVNVLFNNYSPHTAPSLKYQDIMLNENGLGEIRIPLSDLKTLLPYYRYDENSPDRFSYLRHRTVFIKANVTETLTQIVLSGEGSVRFVEYKYKNSFTQQSPSFFRSGMKYTGFVSIVQQDDSPPDQEDITFENGTVKSFLITSECRYTIRDDENSRVQTTTQKYFNQFQIHPSGITRFEISIPAQCDWISLQMKSPLPSSYDISKSLSKFKSRDRQFIKLEWINYQSPVPIDSTVDLKLTSTVDSSDYTYYFMSKGVIINSGKLMSAGDFSINVTPELSRASAPSADILVMTETRNGEIMADLITVQIDGLFTNKVELSFSLNKTKPAENLKLNVKARPLSFLAVLAVDQSVKLLGSSNDITQKEVLLDQNNYASGGNNYNPRPFPVFRRKRSICIDFCGGWSFAQSTDQILKDASVIVFTDGFIYKEPERNILTSLAGRPQAEGAPGMVMVDDSVQRKTSATAIATGGNEALAPVTRIREDFPETWLWINDTVGADGEKEFTVSAPDTITSWIASGFVTHPQYGLGIANQPAKLTVFKPFFVSMSLPYSVIRGEEIALSVQVFNYLPSNLRVTITLEESQMFKVREANSILEPKNTLIQQSILVPSNSGRTVFFWIIANQIGNVLIRISAQSSVAADAVQRLLLVEPEGIRQYETTSMLISLSRDTTSFSKTVFIEIPSIDLVSGSEHITVTAIGDILGASINNLDHLLRVPSGCGEQNMLGFAPNIFVSQYLKSSNSLTTAISQRANSNMETGYQRELTFQREEGSFSAFGSRDKAGSTWLTAFVVKCFNQAKQFIFVDNKELEDAITWLLNRNSNGHFTEPPYGRVIHSSMQGGSSNGIALTAYVLIALKEENLNVSLEIQDRINSVISQTTRTLENSLSTISNDIYSLSIVTYALVLAKSNLLSQALSLLEQKATTEDGMRYWKSDEDNSNKRMPLYNRKQSSSSSIEMTSYVLLTYAKLNQIEIAIPIMKWLSSQQSENGGFRSTQDTVLGLQSLAAFASRAQLNKDGEVSIAVESSSPSQNYQFNINSQNSLILHKQQLDKRTRNLKIRASGTRIAMFQVNVAYNIKKILPRPGINVKVKVIDIHPNSHILNICGRYTLSSPSGMVVCEIESQSGFSIDDTILRNRYGTIGLKKSEKLGRITTVYFDELTERDLCFQVSSNKINPVVNPKPSAVSCYKYYENDIRDTQSYLVWGNQDMCNFPETKGICSEGSMSPKYTPVVSPNTVDSSAPSTINYCSYSAFTFIVMLIMIF